MSIYQEILETVIENGRVIADEEGYIDRESLIVEVEFEAQEQSLSEAETAEAVEFSLRHSLIR